VIERQSITDGRQGSRRNVHRRHPGLQRKLLGSTRRRLQGHGRVENTGGPQKITAVKGDGHADLSWSRGSTGWYPRFAPRAHRFSNYTKWACRFHVVLRLGILSDGDTTRKTENVPAREKLAHLASRATVRPRSRDDFQARPWKAAKSRVKHRPCFLKTTPEGRCRGVPRTPLLTQSPWRVS